MPDIKLDKELLAKIVSEAQHRYLERGNCDGTQYLSSAETLARAYVEATLAVLKSQGYVLSNK